MVETLFRRLWFAPRNAAIGLVRLYQQTLSPDHGPLKHLWTYGYCRHEPTCSMYAIARLRERGFVLGSLLAFLRILSCNPFRKPSDEKMRSLAEHALRK